MHGFWKVDPAASVITLFTNNTYGVGIEGHGTLGNFFVFFSFSFVLFIMQDLQQVLESMAAARKSSDDNDALFNFQKSSRHDEFQATLQEIVKFRPYVKLSNGEIDETLKLSNGEIDEAVKVSNGEIDEATVVA